MDKWMNKSMEFHVLTLFPEMILQGTQTSIIGRAINNGHISLNAVNIRDFTESKHKKVDDYPYGGGAGMLMQAQPVYDAFQSIKKNQNLEKSRVIYLTPQGQKFNQKMAEEFSREDSLIFLCGHYEGIDERVLEEIVTDYVSVGDYVLTGGELPAMVMIDAIARLVPGVLSNDTSADYESFHNDLLEYPQYSRPEVWRDKKVPQILLSGDHKKVDAWRLEQSIARTKDRRPDLYIRYMNKQHQIQILKQKNKLLYIDMIESLKRGSGELYYAGEEGMIVINSSASICMIAAFCKEALSDLADAIEKIRGNWQFIIHQEVLIDLLKEHYAVKEVIPCRQAVYTRRVSLPVSKAFEIKVLDITYQEEVSSHYNMISEVSYIKDRLIKKNIFGAFIDGKLAGFAGVHTEGSLGILEVYEEYRRQGVATALEAYMINYHLALGYTPYGNIVADNEVSFHLQEKMGLSLSKEMIFWVIAEEK